MNKCIKFTSLRKEKCKSDGYRHNRHPQGRGHGRQLAHCTIGAGRRMSRIGTDATKSGEFNSTAEMYPVIASIATIYGDPTGKYQAFLTNANQAEPFFLWAQNVKATPIVSSTIVNPSQTGSVGPNPTHSSTNTNGAMGRSTSMSSSLWMSIMPVFVGLAFFFASGI